MPVKDNLPELNQIMQEMRVSHPQYAHLGDHTLAAAILQKFPTLAKGYDSAKQFALQATQLAQAQQAPPGSQAEGQPAPAQPSIQQTAQDGLGIADMIHQAVHRGRDDYSTLKTLYQAEPPAQ